MKTAPRLLTALPSALATLFLLAPTLRATWPQQYGTSANDLGYAVATDAAGNVFSGGYTEGSILGQTALGSSDGYVAKWDTTGTLQWANLFGTTSTDQVRGLARVGASGVTAVGSTLGSLPGFTNTGNNDAMVRLYDSAGAVTWTQQYGTSGSDFLYAAGSDSLGHVYVGGATSGSFAGYTNSGGLDLFVSQLDAATGAVNWTFQLGSSGSDQGLGLAADSLGNVYLGGFTSGALPLQTSLGSSDAFLLKLDVSGSLQWVRQFGSTAFDQASGVAVDSTGAILLAGVTTGVLPGETSNGGNDAFVRKYDAAGNVTWTKQFGTSDSDVGSGVAVDGADRVVLGGYTSGVFPGETTPDAGQDAFVRVLQADGTEVQTDQFGGTGSITTLGVAVDASGNAYLSGQATGALPGFTNQGSGDAFIVQAVLVPEPGSALLLAAGGLALLTRRRARV